MQSKAVESLSHLQKYLDSQQKMFEYGNYSIKVKYLD